MARKFADDLEAGAYGEAPGATAMQPADIADAARAMSGFVVCR